MHDDNMPETPVLSKKAIDKLREQLKYTIIRLFSDHNFKNYDEIKPINVFDDKWRVNVYVKGKIVMSFFIRAGDNGQIIDSKPEILRSLVGFVPKM